MFFRLLVCFSLYLLLAHLRVVADGDYSAYCLACAILEGIAVLILLVERLVTLAQHFYYAEGLNFLAYAVAHSLLHRLSVLTLVELLLLGGVQKRHEAVRLIRRSVMRSMMASRRALSASLRALLK